MLDISIIVPIYNVEPFLKRCLDSILSQDFKGKLEIICVDDASSDDSFFIVQKYQSLYSSIKLIRHQTNRGLSAARSTGIDYACGRYIMHVDSDDWILPNALNELYDQFSSFDVDVLVFNYTRGYASGKQFEVALIKDQIFTFDKNRIQELFFGACVNKIVKRSLLNDMVYSQVSLNSSEDIIYSFEVFLRAQSFLLIPQSYYVYYNNYESITHKFINHSFLESQVPVLKQISAIQSRYKLKPAQIESVLKVLWKWIILNLCKSMFWSPTKNQGSSLLLKALQQFKYSEDNLHSKYLRASGNRYYALYLVFLEFGIRISGGILLVGSLKNMKLMK